ncbi:RCC1 domain-containing protein RUG3, mitochondrial isoform X2 [Malania oleifera]|uniref:RCC1 domain-containing protein RUG3, mitochondrial isoform X2 n=1 Tax=Malania oleifera TaxID=397392 RepID=UPI0025AEBEEB|nr:RCC1 domain-containing protein RUG3, mitochondrial isoform X2 [Malania oleifera]
MALRRRCTSLQLRRYISSSFSVSSSSSSSSPTTASFRKVPLLWKPQDQEEGAVTLQLLSWGRGSSGQLGGGIEEIRLYPTPVASLLLPPSFHLSQPIPGRLPLLAGDDHFEISISCGLFHSSLLVDGSFWIWGKGDGGRLGFGHENPAFLPTLNPNLDSVRSIALGGVHSVALTSLGQVFTWGYGGFGALGHSVYHRELFPRLVEGGWTGKICHIATSGAHTAAITESGEVYTWGRDEGDGRLGLGPGCGPNEGGGFSVPSKVEALPVPMAAVSCGGFFTLALTNEGQLWNWGANSNYELGRGNRIGGWQPQPVPSLENMEAKYFPGAMVDMVSWVIPLLTIIKSPWRLRLWLMRMLPILPVEVHLRQL